MYQRPHHNKQEVYLPKQASHTEWKSAALETPTFKTLSSDVEEHLLMRLMPQQVCLGTVNDGAASTLAQLVLWFISLPA
jgi:hypothetical protein